MLKNLLLVGIGGFAGSIVRFLIYWLVDKRLSTLYPWSTFIVNITGSFILGMLMGLLIKSAVPNDNLRLLLGVGFCGSFTTFSTFASENLLLIQEKAVPMAILYISCSLIFGLAAVYGGYFVGRTIL